jgi:hypothetical protein
MVQILGSKGQGEEADEMGYTMGEQSEENEVNTVTQLRV